ncbi:MAG: Hsp70 family protein, partial [Actinomycetota bacterium]
MTVFGIDLGTTYSCIASIDDSGRASVIKNSDGEDTTPSVVWFEDEQSIVVGRSAKDSAIAYPDQVVSLIKRSMGTDRFSTFFGRDYTPEETSSFILRRLAGDASRLLHTEVSDVVITVPAYFGIAERDATRKAGQIAGLEVLDIVSEPIAAAIDYGVLDIGEDKT